MRNKYMERTVLLKDLKF